MKTLIFICPLFLSITGCCGPAKWSEDLSVQLRCGMTVSEVQSITKYKIIEMNPPAGWKTHLVRDNATDLYLGFVEGKLKFIQIAWAQKMLKMAMYHQIDICTNTMTQ